MKSLFSFLSKIARANIPFNLDKNVFPSLENPSNTTSVSVDVLNFMEGYFFCNFFEF